MHNSQLKTAQKRAVFFVLIKFIFNFAILIFNLRIMDANHHTIKAVLYPNLLKNNEGTYKAQTITEQTLGIKDICSSFCSKPGTGVDPDAMEYHVRLFLEEMGELLAEGFAINTGYFAATASIRGSFNSKHDTFDKEKHAVTYKFTQGSVLRKKAAETHAEILHITSTRYGIQYVVDNHSGSENNLLTPSNALKIKGINVKLVGSHPDVGVYFINETTGERTKVPATDVVINENSRLMIMIPDLQSGSYHLEYITQYAGSAIPLAEPRSSTFAPTLQVT